MITEDELRITLNKAWQLGQTYWQQADSESIKQQNKSNDTRKQFNGLVEDTIKELYK